eukprot:1157366-Pelagomonas_calceolata.AAC.5
MPGTITANLNLLLKGGTTSWKFQMTSKGKFQACRSHLDIPLERNVLSPALVASQYYPWKMETQNSLRHTVSSA